MDYIINSRQARRVKHMQLESYLANPSAGKMDIDKDVYYLRVQDVLGWHCDLSRLPSQHILLFFSISIFFCSILTWIFRFFYYFRII